MTSGILLSTKTFYIKKDCNVSVVRHSIYPRKSFMKVVKTAGKITGFPTGIVPLNRTDK